jgi:hypothetical protein
MAEKGPLSRGERVAVSYKMPPNIYEKVRYLVYEEKKFSTVSDCITQALISFVGDTGGHKDMQACIREYLASEEGRAFIKSQVREVLADAIVSGQDTGTGTRPRP